MSEPTRPTDVDSIWTPLSRSELESLLASQPYTRLHLHILYWLIWLPLLSGEELVRVLSSETDPRLRVATSKALSEQVSQMTQLKLLDAITLREPGMRRHRRYYVTDLGLYLYLAAIQATPPLTIAQLARAYPVERDDLLARLARPSVHLALMALASRLVAEGAALGYCLSSYQQPWQHTFLIHGRQQRVRFHAALLLQQPAGTTHAFLVHVDPGPRYRSDHEEEKRLLHLLDLRAFCWFRRQSWPGILILTVPERLPFWATLLRESRRKRLTTPLAGGLTTIQALDEGVFTPIWWNLAALPYMKHPMQESRVSLQDILGDPASPELTEQFSQQERFHQLRIREAAKPLPRTGYRLARYVGNSLQDEAAALSVEHIEAFFAGTRKDQLSVTGTGLLTLALTPQQKAIITWLARHPLLDLLTLQTLVRPGADPQAIKLMQRHMTRLFRLHLVETELWPQGRTALEQQRYLLSAPALRFVAIRGDERFSTYFVPPKDRKRKDAIGRQWGTLGLRSQMYHTNALYTCMRELFQGAHTRGEVIADWRSAHEAARTYRTAFLHHLESARPDAELVCAPSPAEACRTLLVEYDRGTTDEAHYYRKFKAYLHYQTITRTSLPPLVMIAPHTRAIQTMRRALARLQEPFPVTIVLEQELRIEGLAAIFRHLS